jgi:hypothetical protein
MLMSFFSAVVVNKIESETFEKISYSDNDSRMSGESSTKLEPIEQEVEMRESIFEVDIDEATSGEGVRASLGDQFVVWKWKEMSLSGETGVIESLYSVNDVRGVKQDNIVTFKGTYPFTSEIFTISKNNIKHDIVLDQLPKTEYNIGEIDHLSFIGTLELSEGLQIFVDGMEHKGDFITSSAIHLKNSGGAEQFFIPSPYAFEPDNEMETVECFYRIEHVNGEILFHVSTPYEWLEDPSRNYPIVIDPTICTLYEPVADAGLDQIGYVNETMYFDGSESHDVDGYIVSYEWDFGDGSPPGSGEMTNHVFNPSGVYTVTLTVTDNDGLTGHDTTIMYISNSIQDLIDAASPGATINVPSDHYWERIIIDKPLTLIGWVCTGTRVSR